MSIGRHYRKWSKMGNEVILEAATQDLIEAGGQQANNKLLEGLASVIDRKKTSQSMERIKSIPDCSSP